MEDMARLALVEESVRDIDKFQKILYELLRHINNILENPHDHQLRTIKSNILKEVAKFDSFSEYLKYVGFELGEDNFIYPNKSTLSNLRMAQVAIERKINFCFGSLDNNKSLRIAPSQLVATRFNMFRTNPLSTSNRFLLKIQDLLNNMLAYEDAELQELARQQVPLVTLQLMALDRVRDQQAEIKTGKTKAHDLPFDIALLMELLSWFKHKFFSWVDQPECEACGAPTAFSATASMTTPTETCRVEVYKCTSCPGGARFPRYNDARMLLRTRRGRCGEWANCFALLLRALGYDARYVYDTTDHVWCEVFDYDSNTWLHCDPCEAKLNAPLMYCHGWGKKLSYVIAASRDDVQDVTWRYTTDHKEVLKRRTECSEEELISAILCLRAARQRQVSEPRRHYLARRTLQELVMLMQERKPSDYESHGRISGSAAWRADRGESGAQTYTFELTRSGNHAIRYYSGTDKYRVSHDQTELAAVGGWRAGAFHAKNMARKVELDWRKVYLARTEGESEGSISWKVCVGAGLRGVALTVRLIAAVFESGQLSWRVGFDSQPEIDAELGETPTHFARQFSSVVITAQLSGGVGDVAWQHAQLFRHSLDTKSCAFEILAQVDTA